MPNEIRPIEPKGLEMIPTKPIPDPKPVEVKADTPAINDNVSTFNIILLWLKEQLIGYITKARSGEAVSMGIPSIGRYAIAVLIGIIIALILVHIF